MYYFILIFTIYNVISTIKCDSCESKCPQSADGEMTCAFDPKSKLYTMFPSKCAMDAYIKCYKSDLVETPLNFCIKAHHTKSRKNMYEDSCPVFCPQYYRPVCGASRLRAYIYRTFINGCYLDMLTCRGDDETDGYVEVPLEFCQRHAMKNIFKEQIIFTNVHDLPRDYADYMG